MTYHIEIITSKAGPIAIPRRSIDALTQLSGEQYAQEIADEEGGTVHLIARSGLFDMATERVIGVFEPSPMASRKWEAWQTKRGIAGEFHGMAWVPAKAAALAEGVSTYYLNLLPSR